MKTYTTRTYKGYKYQIMRHEWGNVYNLYNEQGEVESEFLDLDELKEAVNNRIKYGYWNY